jgi:glycosyl transferase family 25
MDSPGFFINLSHRVDRRAAVELELSSAGLINVMRLDAIKDENGALGCAKSHIRALRALSLGTENSLAVVCEDDLDILCKPTELRELLLDFVSCPPLDVLCLANHTLTPSRPFTDLLGLTNNTQTTACYVVKGTAVETLIRCFEESASMLEAGVNPEKAAIDMHWKKYQQKQLLFAVPLITAAIQRPSFSDVENRFVKYGI